MAFEPVFVGIFGLLIGSFLNVCVYRVPRKLSTGRPLRSFCPACETTLAWWHNVPVISWVLLGGKCYFCRARISGQYPLVELLSAVAALAAYVRFDLTPTGVLVYLLCASLIVITFIDLEFKIIPNVISYPGMTIGLCLGIASQYSEWFVWPITQGALDSLLGFLAGGGFFYVIGKIYFLFSKRVGLGGGDIKLLAMTGAILGLSSVPPTIFAGSLFGAVVGLLTIVIKGGGRHTEIPFGPWLALGAITYIFADMPFFRVF